MDSRFWLSSANEPLIQPRSVCVDNSSGMFLAPGVRMDSMAGAPAQLRNTREKTSPIEVTFMPGPFEGKVGAAKGKPWGYEDVNAWSCVDQVPNGDRQLDAGTARRVARWRDQNKRNAATTAARITRYQAKASRLWRRRKFRRKRMTSQPQIPEVRMPTTS